MAPVCLCPDVCWSGGITGRYLHPVTVQTALLQLIFDTVNDSASLDSCLDYIITLLCQDGLLAVCQSPVVQHSKTVI